MNFLHYAIFMFVVCCGCAGRRQLYVSAPDRKKLAGLTFATVGEKMDIEGVARPSLAKETRTEHFMNVAFTLVLLSTVVGLWIYFR